MAGAAAVRAKNAELFPEAKVICSAVTEMPGTRRVGDVRDPHDLADVDVDVVRSRLGVAEAGAVRLADADLVVDSLGVLTQHLVVLLDLASSSYGVFTAGPSATADVEGVVNYGAQGARTMTILLLANHVNGGL